MLLSFGFRWVVRRFLGKQPVIDFEKREILIIWGIVSLACGAISSAYRSGITVSLGYTVVFWTKFLRFFLRDLSKEIPLQGE